MLMFGKNIQSAQDKLQKVDIEWLYKNVKEPDEQLTEMLDYLKSLAVIDPELYRQQKRRLPYVVPSIFKPPYRRKENFSYSEYLILDFDHLSEKDLSPDLVKDKLSKDSRVQLIFISPSGDGIKVFFRLNQRITDHNAYSMFYKIFATEFAKSYGLEQVFDSRTSDVTRACFLSIDVFAYFNPKPEPVPVDSVLKPENALLVVQKQKKIDKQNKAIVKAQPQKPQKKVSDDIFREIKAKLNPNYRPRTKEKKIFVPQELNRAEEAIRQKMKEMGIEVLNVRNINYGKQFLFGYQGRKAEINLFFGKKRGFTIVKTVRNFNCSELQDIVYQIIDQTLEKL